MNEKEEIKVHQASHGWLAASERKFALCLNDEPDTLKRKKYTGKPKANSDRKNYFALPSEETEKKR